MKAHDTGPLNVSFKECCVIGDNVNSIEKNMVYCCGCHTYYFDEEIEALEWHWAKKGR